MKYIFVIVFACFVSAVSSGQSTFRSETHLTNVGVGIGSNYGPNSFGLLIPPLGISYEYGVSKVVSVGGYFGVTANRFGEFRDGYEIDVFYFITGVRASYHLHKVLGTRYLDPYIGGIVGFNFHTLNDPEGRYGGPDLGGFLGGLHAGVRYYTSDHFGFFGELGLGIAVFQTGITLKY